VNHIAFDKVSFRFQTKPSQGPHTAFISPLKKGGFPPIIPKPLDMPELLDKILPIT
jgi:hypothetical protein